MRKRRQFVPVELLRTPYAHELNSFGSDCAAECPACLWVASIAGSKAQEKVLLNLLLGPGRSPRNAPARRCLARHGRVDGAA